MRVIAITTWFPTTVSPSRGAFVVQDALAIATLHDVRVIHLVPPQDDDGTRHTRVAGLEVLRLPMKPSDPVSVMAASRALAAALADADVVHTMAFSSLLPMVLRRPRAAWVHTEHWSGITTPSTLPRGLRTALPVALRALRRPDVVTAVCEFLADPIRRVRTGRESVVVPCIVPPRPGIAPRRARDDGRLLLISTGGLIERKDPLLALETVALLARQGVDVHLTWLGDGPLRPQVEARAAQEDLAGRIALMGSVPPERVVAELGKADLFFGPTRADNFFVSAAEAIVAGRPVVVGATGGQGEYITPTSGRLVTRQDAADYAAAILELDEATRGLTSEQIAATIGDAFSRANVAAGYGAAYDRALALRGSR